MSKSRDLAALLDSSGDVVAGALDNAGGGGGAWNYISKNTISSAVSSVTFTGLGSSNTYDEFMFVFHGLYMSASTWFRLSATDQNNSSISNWEWVVNGSTASSGHYGVDSSSSSTNGLMVLNSEPLQGRWGGELRLSNNGSAPLFIGNYSLNGVSTHTHQLLISNMAGKPDDTTTTHINSITFDSQYGSFLSSGEIRLYGLASS
jgi:hypothetical protein